MIVVAVAVEGNISLLPCKTYQKKQSEEEEEEEEAGKNLSLGKLVVL